jgi:hypothetical protein
MVAFFGVVAVDVAEEREVVVVVVFTMVEIVMGVSVLAAVTVSLSAVIAVVAVEVVLIAVVVVVVVVVGPLRWPLPLPTGRHGCSGLSCRARSKHASTVFLRAGNHREFCVVL